MTKKLLKKLEKADIRFVRILWCDNANVIRGKAVHIGMLDRYLKYGVSIAAAQQALPVMYDAPVSGSGLSPVGEVQLVPDWDTLTYLPYAPHQARVMGDMVKEGQAWDLCPRTFLKRQIAEAEAMGLQVMAAYENEFYLLKEGIIPADGTVFASTLAMDLHQPVIDEIAEALIMQGLPVEQYYPESGSGQQEISTRYTHALQASDRQIIFRETVKAIAHQHHLIASFLPKIFANQAGSGCHLHLSLWHQGKNLLPDNDKLSKTARYFIAGLLHHLPALMAITTPIPNSYRRLQPHFWSGAFRCWGYDNREAAIRVPSNPEAPKYTHFELKTVDATANPYLALGAVIAAGLDGIRRQLEAGEPVAIDPGYLDKSERLPTDLSQSLAHLRGDEILLKALGSSLSQAYLAIKQAEWLAMKDLKLKEEVQLLLERY